MRLVSGIFFALTAYAHRPSESSVDVHWEHGRLELQAVLSSQMATTLLAKNEVVLLRADNFDINREDLQTVLASAFLVKRAGVVVSPELIKAVYTHEGEIAVSYIFPASAQNDLTLQAHFLSKLSVECFCLFRLWKDADSISSKRILARSEFTVPLECFVRPAAAEACAETP